MSDEQSVLEIAAGFRVDGVPVSARTVKHGHIHDTWVSTVRGARGEARFVHQRLNRAVFPWPERVMENVERVTQHVRARLSAAGQDAARGTLTVIPALDGRSYHVAQDGGVWRTYRFIEGARTFSVVQGPRHAFEAARAFARFLALVADLPGPPLHETVPAFADTGRRFEAFARALESDRARRAARAAPEVAFARGREELARLLVDLPARGAVPRRVVHHDTKIDNVLIDDRTGEGICVIDLDTVMHGTALFDFGDMVRYGACRAAEDDAQPERAVVDLELFEQLVRGWVGEAGALLTPVELDQLVPAARCLTFVAGLRFLTDFLEGDRYFRTARPDHNLVRCRVQFALVRDLEARDARLGEIVERWRGGRSPGS